MPPKVVTTVITLFFRWIAPVTCLICTDTHSNGQTREPETQPAPQRQPSFPYSEIPRSRDHLGTRASPIQKMGAWFFPPSAGTEGYVSTTGEWVVVSAFAGMGVAVSTWLGSHVWVATRQTNYFHARWVALR